MIIVHEMSIDDYEPWSGAVATYERIVNAGKLQDLEGLLDDMFHNATCTDTELNDLLWFESDMVYEILGMKSDREIEEERKLINELRESLTKLDHAKTAEDFCSIWSDELDQYCINCPLCNSELCGDDVQSLDSFKDKISVAINNIKKALEEKEKNLDEDPTI